MRKIITCSIFFILAFLFFNSELFAQPGKALKFSGGITYVNAPAKSTTVAGSYTVMAWVMPASTTGPMHIFSTRESAEFSFDMQLVNGNKIHADIGNGSSFMTTAADADFKYISNQWIHVAYTVSPTGYKIYANGTQVGAGTFSGTPLLLNATHYITIGKNASESTYFNGNIDEVKVYSSELTAANVKADMLSTTPSVPASLVAYYNFDQSASTLTDLSGNGYDGTLRNFIIATDWVESYAMVVPGNISATGVTTAEFTANWVVPVNGTTDNYVLDVATKNDFTEPVAGSPFVVTGTSKTIAALSGTTYYYRVKANKSSVAGQGVWSDVTTVNTIATYDYLSAVTLSDGVLSPAFSASKTTYSTTVPGANLTFVPTQSNSGAIIEMQINGAGYVVVSSGAPKNVPLNPGVNTIEIKVSAGANSRIYKFTVNRIIPVIRYVKQNGSGNKDGFSWANASDDLQLMINNSSARDEIWVSGGKYKPVRRADDLGNVVPLDRNNAFVLKADVKIYGGFSGAESNLADRNITLATDKSILSGDFSDDDVINGSGSTLSINNNGENAYHVIVSSGPVQSALLDGFTISGGNANLATSTIQVNGVTIYRYGGGGIHTGSSSPAFNNVKVVHNSSRLGAGFYNVSSSPIITNSVISQNVATGGSLDNLGGGMNNSDGSSPVLTGVLIEGNISTSGGGIINRSSSPILTNVIIRGNHARGNRFYLDGGGIYNETLSNAVLTNVLIVGNTAKSGGGINNYNSSPILTNVTISGNTASEAGNGMFNENSSSPKVRNSIIWGGNNGLENSGSTPVINYSIIQGGYSGTGNKNENPAFADPGNGDYSLKAGSGAIGAGSITYFGSGQTPDLSAITTDLAGKVRIPGTDVDMGAYEFEQQFSAAALNFDGTDDKIVFTPSITSVSGSFTVMGWVRPTEATKNMHILSTRNTGGSGFDIQLQGGNKLRANIGTAGGVLTATADASFNYTTARWMHIAYSVSPAGYQIYVNGELAGSGMFSGSPVPLLMDAAHVLQIGHNGSENTFFKGDMDELRIYRTALAQAGIQADMLRLKSSSPADLIAHYNFDNGTPDAGNAGLTSLTDKSSNGYHGTLTGFSLTGSNSNWVESYAMVVPVHDQITNILPTGFTANWSVPEVGIIDNGYVIEVAQDKNFDIQIAGSPFAVTGTSKVISGLTPGSIYYYRVRADKTTVTGQGAYSKIVSVGVDTPPGSALNFDGANDYVSVAPQSTAVSGSFTVMAWVRPTNATKTMHIFSTRETGDQSFDIQLVGGNKIHADIGDGAAWITLTADANYNYAVNKWMHIAYSVSPTGYKIYVNGVETGSGILSGTPLLMDAARYITIGKNASENSYFEGDIDEVKVYNAALTAANVQSDMVSTLPAVPLSLIAYYHFDQGGGIGLTDQGSRGYNGTLNNFALAGANSNWIESYAMVLPVPEAATNISSSSFSANWGVPLIGVADSYLLDVSANQNFNTMIAGAPFTVKDLSKRVSGLAPGSTYYYRLRADKISVTGQGAYGKTNTVTTAAPNADLSALLLSDGTLSPVFSSADVVYTAAVANIISALTVTPTATGFYSAIEVSVNGAPGIAVNNGSASPQLALNAGSNTIVVKVTDEDGLTVKNYTITVTRALADQVISFAALPNKIYGDADFNLTATGGASGNQVTFQSSNAAVATITGNVVTIVGAGNTVITASQTGNSSYNAAADVTQSLTVNKAVASITLGNLSQTYDGTTKFATATINPVGLSGISITYDGAATLPTEAGTYEVVAALSHVNYTAADATGSLVIAKGTATLALNNLSHTYDGTAKSATITTNPVGLSGVSITYDGSATMPIAVGTYAVVASLSNVNYTATDATGNLVIGKGTAILTLSDLSHTYDGGAKPATITTNPAGLSGVSITYDGLTTVPTAAGTYAVIASLNNANYTATNVTGSLVIGKGTATLALNNLSQTYDGTGKSATVTTNPAGLSGVSITYDGLPAVPTAAGTYTVIASLNNANYTATNVTGSLVIGKGTATLALNNLSQAYDGTGKSATVTTNPAGLSGVSITYDGLPAVPTAAGTYTVIASLNNANYTATNVTGSLVIGKGTATLALNNLSQTYDGTGKSATVTTNPAGLSGVSITYDGLPAVPTAAGTYTVIASLNNANYTATNVTGSLLIGKGTATLALNNLSRTYDGTGKSATVTTDPAGLSGVSITYDGLAALPTAAGTYAVVASLSNANYTAANATGSLVIGKGTATLALSNLLHSYDGSAKSATVTTNPAGLSGVSIRYDGSSIAPTAAGTYTVVASLHNANYTATDATGSLVIGKGTATLALNNLSQTYDGTGKSATVTTNPVGLSGVSITYDGLTVLPTTAGTYVVVASLSNANYTAADATGSLLIGKGTATLLLSNLSQAYDGTAKSATVTTNPIGLSGVSITYDGLATMPTATGTYAVVASLSNTNYSAINATGSLVIGKGTATLVLSNLSQTYDGTGKSATVTTNPVGLSGISITYDGLAAMPTAAGTYAVVASLSNTNYSATDVTGSLVIGKGTATLALSDLLHTYDGTAKSATVTTNPVGLSGVSITYDGLAAMPTAAGTYAVVASLSNTNYTAIDATGSLVIGKGTATLALSNLSHTYDGSAKSATVTTNPVGLSGVSITYDGLATLPTAAGTYTVVASLNNANYTATDVTGSLVIGKGTATLALSNLLHTYDGTAKSVTVTTNPVGLSGGYITYDGSSIVPTAAGTYTVVAGLNNTNYMATNVTGNLVIGKGTATLALSNLSQTYDGTIKTAIAITHPIGLTGVTFTYNGSALAPTNAGAYTVVASLANGNYTSATVTGSMVIDKATATLTLHNLSQSYDGTAKTINVTTNPVNLTGIKITYNGDIAPPSSAGAHLVEASLTNANYTAVNVTGTLTIGHISQNISFEALADKLSTDPVFTLNATSSSGLIVTYISSDPNIAKIINGNQVQILKAGIVAITASQAGNINYAAAIPIVQPLKIIDNPLPLITIVSNKGNRISKGETAILTASGAISYQWSAPNGMVSGQNTAVLTIRPSITTIYTVTGVNEYGRSNSQTIKIEVVEDLNAVNATNLITPNGDRINDFWLVNNIDMYPGHSIRIFDRAGKILLQLRDYKNDWDGTVNGTALEEGTYYYIIDFGNRKELKKGYITIVRN